MFELTLTIDGEEDVFQSASQQTLIREVLEVFKSRNADVYPLPFSCFVNSRGQITTLTLENKPNDPYWIEYHPVNGKQVSVKASIIKASAKQAKESYEIPLHLYDLDGNCWAAISEGKVVDLVYMRCKKDDFAKHRQNALDRLKPQGTVLHGMITTKKFLPRAPKWNSERG